MSSDTITGSHIADRYQVTGYVRSARMGDIYVGRRLADNLRVLIKLMDPALSSEPEVVKRFKQECMITSELRHPCSLEVLDYGQSEQGHLFMVTEYVTGELLSDVLDDEGRVAPERAGWITAQIAMALAAAHEFGVIHRDLTPNNIMLINHEGHRDLVKVLEFGLSRLSEAGSGEGLTAVGIRIGNPAYMAPEYIEDYALDHRADLYSLGIVLYQMLVGQPPFKGRPYKVMDMHLNRDVPPPSAKAQGTPTWMDELLSGLTRKAPDERFTTSEAVRRLEAGLGRRLEPVPTHNDDLRTPAPAPELVREPTAEAPSIDPILTHFIDERTREVDREQAIPPDKSSCLVVKRVAEVSIAASLGVEPGWLLHLPEEPVSALRSPHLYQDLIQYRKFHFYGPDRQFVEFECDGTELGAEYLRSPEHIRAYYDAGDSDPRVLIEIWLQKDWNTMNKLALRTLTGQKGTVGVLNTGLFAKFLGRGEIKIRNHPALLMHGAALVETGQPGGMDLVKEYKTHYALQWAPVFNAIAHYYLALAKARAGADKLAVDLLLESLAIEPLERTQEAVEKMVGRRAVLPSHVGEHFPDYALDGVEGRPAVRFMDTIAQMEDSQVLVVCLLGGFRGNQAYNEFLERYLAYVAWFPEFVAGLHVITTVTSRPEGHPEHYRAEDMIQAAKLPIGIYEDYRAFVQRAVKPMRVPTGYVINKQGIVVSEGPLTPAAWWDALATAGRYRLEAFARGHR